MALKNQVFISYAHADAPVWVDEFMTMLSPAIARGQISLWSDRAIDVGQNWREQIEEALHSAGGVRQRRTSHCGARKLATSPANAIGKPATWPPCTNMSLCHSRMPSKATTVPRHREINEHLARKICKDLEIAVP